MRFKLLTFASLLLVSTLVMAACQSGSPAEPASGSATASLGQAAGLAASAEVQFGVPGVGSPFPPPQGHDSSSHAQDNLVPRTVVIQRGGRVTFNTFGPHGVAIYEDGVDPRDIDTSVLAPPSATCPPVPLIDDPEGRVAVVAPQPCAGGTTAPAYTFHNPGRYLVICRFLPHFAQFDMYGWVIVK
jgi:plastocyanin